MVLTVNKADVRRFIALSRLILLFGSRSFSCQCMIKISPLDTMLFLWSLIMMMADGLTAMTLHHNYLGELPSSSLVIRLFALLYFMYMNGDDQASITFNYRLVIYKLKYCYISRLIYCYICHLVSVSLSFSLYYYYFALFFFMLKYDMILNGQGVYCYYCL